MPYTEPVQSIDQEDVKDMQVQKYQLGKQIAEFESLFGGKRVFKIIPKTGGRLDIFEEDLVDWGATPLIESEPAKCDKLNCPVCHPKSEPEMLEEDPKRMEIHILSTFDYEDQVTRICEYLSKINRAINALQKGK